MKPAGPWHNRDWLKERFVDQEQTQTAIAEEAGVSRTAVYKALIEYGFLVRLEPEPHTEPDECALDCPYWERCLDWPVNRPCPRIKKKGDRE